VHLTLGILRTSQAVSHALAFSQLDGFAVPRPSAGNANRWATPCKTKSPLRHKFDMFFCFFLRDDVGEKMFKAKVYVISKKIILVLILLCVTTACAAKNSSETIVLTSQQLRITNNGDADIIGLEVLFPGPTWDAKASRVEFGNIPAGKTSEYQNVPSGVYKYAAYEYMLNGQKVEQFVTDWVGESPMEGNKFTYQITLDLNKVVGNQVNLINVLIDEP
jgi:hypothetical protein